MKLWGYSGANTTAKYYRGQTGHTAHIATHTPLIKTAGSQFKTVEKCFTVHIKL